MFICGVDVDDDRPRCACDVPSATPSPSTAVRLATTPRSTSALCVIATTSSRRPRPGSSKTFVYGSTSSVCICGDVDSCALDALKDADCDDVCGGLDNCPPDTANDVDDSTATVFAATSTRV